MRFLELTHGKQKGVAPFAYDMMGECLYFCDLNLPGLFRYHFEKKLCECVVCFDSRHINRNFFKILIYKDEVWMLPFLDGDLVCFNMRTARISYYSISKNVEEKRIPFIGMAFSGNEAFILPNGNNRFLFRVNLVTHKMEEIEVLKIVNKDEQVSFTDAVQVDNKIYLFEGNRNTIFLFDINNNELEVIDVNGYLLKERTVGVIGNKIYLFPWDIKEKLLIYDITKNNFSEKEYPIKSLSQGEECVVIVHDKKIWILANKNRKIFQLNQDLEIESIVSDLNINIKEKKYISGRATEDRIFFHGHDGVPLMQIKDGEVQTIDINKNIIDLFIDMLNNTYDRFWDKFGKSEVGKKIYGNIKIDDKSL